MMPLLKDGFMFAFFHYKSDVTFMPYLCILMYQFTQSMNSYFHIAHYRYCMLFWQGLFHSLSVFVFISIDTGRTGCSACCINFYSL